MDVYEEFVHERREDRARAMATVVAGEGSSPSHENAAMVVHEDGSIVGLVTERAARAAGFTTVVDDDRPDFADDERFRSARTVLSASFEEPMAKRSPTRRAPVFDATRRHELDGEVLEGALGSDAGHIGMIGSRREVTTVSGRLQNAGVSADAFERVHAPVGLDLGAATPEEFAVSVLAERIAWRRGAAAVRPIMRNRRKRADPAPGKEAC